MTTTEQTLTINIDGREIQAKPGAMVLEAAIEAGIYIPYLCYHPGMKPFAACRMCVVQEEVEVEVEKGRRKGNRKAAQARSGIVHASRQRRDDHQVRQRSVTQPAEGDHGDAHIGASSRLPDLPSR